MKSIYLDNQATTPIDPQVLLAMNPWLIDKFGNAASRNHQYGWEAEEVVEFSREKVASIIGAKSKEIIFTSGATESNNIAVQGIAHYYKNKGKHIITIKTEHKAVLDICDYLEKENYEITYLPIGKDGLLDLNRFEQSIRDDTILASVMHVNNEIGVIQPIKDIGDICNKHKILFHVDAAQSVGKIPIDVYEMNIDLLSISSHKIYGPKGIGALFIKRKTPSIFLQPITYGGGHERGLRPGTLAVANIVGIGKACEISQKVMYIEAKEIKSLRNKLVEKIQEKISNTNINGSMKMRLPGNLNMSFPGTSNEAMIAAMPEISISSGAACTSSSMGPSHVLLALGLSKDVVFSSLRFGIGRFNTDEDLIIAANSIIRSVTKLKKMNHA